MTQFHRRHVAALTAWMLIVAGLVGLGLRQENSVIQIRKPSTLAVLDALHNML